MSIYADAKRHFYADIVQHGIAEVTDFPRVYPLGCAVPDRLLTRWLGKFRELPCEPCLDGQRRFINHYKLGADPEFVFCTHDNLRVDAAALGLKTGQAFGADNNGRLVEVRPAPSRSALNVVASTLEELRWLAMMNPTTRRLAWRAGAYQFRDGLGGHVHLGRKRPTRKAEVGALDQLTEALLGIGFFPKAENDRRRQGDSFGQVYGAPGDIRLQLHGYEYRVFPSWLDSPLHAFISLVLAKLVVYDPTLFDPLVVQREHSPQLHRQRLFNLLAYYKGLDDDALLAMKAIQVHGWPHHEGYDFHARWGLNYAETIPVPKVDFIPDSIKPSADTVRELFELFTEKKALPSPVPKPTWEHATLPAGYHMMLNGYETAHQVGMGELLANVVGHDGLKIQPGIVDHDHLFVIGPSLMKMLPQGWRKKINDIMGMPVQCSSGGNNYSLRVGRRWRDWHRGPHQGGPALLARTRKALLSGVFPLWDIRDLKQSSFDEWSKLVPATPVTKEVSTTEMFYQKEF